MPRAEKLGESEFYNKLFFLYIGLTRLNPYISGQFSYLAVSRIFRFRLLFAATRPTRLREKLDRAAYRPRYTQRAGGWMIAASGGASQPEGEESPDSAGQCAG